jgi:hypothetical protein
MRNQRMALALTLVLTLLLTFSGIAVAAPTDTAGLPSGLGVQPIYYASNQSCQTFSAELIEWKAELPGTFNPAPDPLFGNGTFTVEGGTITITNFDGKYFDWETTGFDIDSVFVKAGNGGNLFLYDTTGPDYMGGPAFSDTKLHGPVTSKGPRAISHVSFCYDLDRETETAFAYGGGSNAADNDATTAFCNLNITQGNIRWGWTMGPLPDGSYTWDVYAGAGQCNLSKGTNVGKVTVETSWNGSIRTAGAIFNPVAGVTVVEEHLYVGSTRLPQNNGKDTLAPGQYYVENTADPVYIIYHATVTK